MIFISVKIGKSEGFAIRVCRTKSGVLTKEGLKSEGLRSS